VVVLICTISISISIPIHVLLSSAAVTCLHIDTDQFYNDVGLLLTPLNSPSCNARVRGSASTKLLKMLLECEWQYRYINLRDHTAHRLEDLVSSSVIAYFEGLHVAKT
jgi:hypothetical protein